MKDSRLLEKLAAALFADPAEREAFRSAILAPRDFAGAVIWTGERPASLPFAIEDALSWQPAFVDRVRAGERPGATELHDQGAIYCLDLSSVAAGSVFHACEKPRRVLDLCSSPGGKAILASRWLRPELLVCNEVIKKRLGALISNLRRCRIPGAEVVSMDSERFGGGNFDLVIVDAPCSGQSLLAKGDRAPGALHPATVNMNSNRQKRILANAIKSTRPGGQIAYMTCTYSREENESVVEWACKRFGVRTVEVEPMAPLRSRLTELHCYRVWPQSGFGAGAFSVLLMKPEETDEVEAESLDLRPIWTSSSNEDEG